MDSLKDRKEALWWRTISAHVQCVSASNNMYALLTHSSAHLLVSNCAVALEFVKFTVEQYPDYTLQLNSYRVSINNMRDSAYTIINRLEA